MSSSPLMNGALEMRERLYAYVGGIARKLGFRLVIAGGTGNHLHALILLPAKIAPAIAIQKIKANSSRFLGSKFAWQDGSGVFTVSASQVPKVKHYIANQEAHHRARTFDEEFTLLLEQYAKAGCRPAEAGL